MKLIYKLLTLFLIPLLAVPVMASTDNMTVNDNYTELVIPVDSVTMPINDSTESTSPTGNKSFPTTVDDAIVEQFNDENERENEQMDDTLPTEQVFVQNNGNYIQALYPYDNIMQLAEGSQAKGNYTFEQELIAFDDEIPFDTYQVTVNNGERYCVVVVYTKGESYDDFGRAQFYFNQYGGAIVRPTPMAICKPLTIQSLNSDWKMKTDIIKNYKIVSSHFGREIEECEEINNTDPEPKPDVPVEKEKKKDKKDIDVNNNDNTVAKVNNTGDNNTITNIATNENKSISQDNTTVNVTANISNNTNSVNILGSNVNGDVKLTSIDKFIGSIENITNSVINFYINYT